MLHSFISAHRYLWVRFKFSSSYITSFLLITAAFLFLKGSLLSDVLTIKPDLIEQMALFLDREMRLIPNWKHFSNELKVDVNVISRLEQYADFSPTIRLFEYLETAQPNLSIQRLKQAFLDIRRHDLFSLLKTTGLPV